MTTPSSFYIPSAARVVPRRTALKRLAAGLSAPFVYRLHAGEPSATLRHASFGANGMALSDILSLTASKHVRLVAVADVDLNRTAEVKERFPHVRVYQDWRKLLDQEKDLDSVNVSTPDHMHAPITMRALRRGLHVYSQKPLTHWLHETRRLTEEARARPLVTQMGIQIHAHEAHRSVVRLIHQGTIGKVSEVHSWSGKDWGDPAPRPKRSDPVPAGFDWDLWLGVAAERPYLGDGYYHPATWRKRLDFGTGTFGDMGCHILDPVFTSLELTAPTAVRSEGDAPNGENWGLNCQVRYEFPGTRRTAETLVLHWYDGNRRPPERVRSLLGGRTLPGQGTVYIGTEGVLFSPYIAMPVLLPEKKFKGHKMPKLGPKDHYREFVEACRGNGKTSASFAYSGPLTEAVLLGCLATRFPKATLQWDAARLRVTNVKEANRFVRQPYRKGWEVEGL